MQIYGRTGRSGPSFNQCMDSIDALSTSIPNFYHPHRRRL